MRVMSNVNDENRNHACYCYHDHVAAVIDAYLFAKISKVHAGCSNRNKSFQSNLGKARRSRTTTQQSTRYWLQWNVPKFTAKTVASSSTITTPSNTAIPRPTPLTTLNNIWIQSVTLPQYTFRTDRQTDRPTHDTQPLERPSPISRMCCTHTRCMPYRLCICCKMAACCCCCYCSRYVAFVLLRFCS